MHYINIPITIKIVKIIPLYNYFLLKTKLEEKNERRLQE